MRLSRNESKFYVRPIFSNKKSYSICLGSSDLSFSDIELIERKNKKVKRRNISLNEIDNLSTTVRSIVNEKVERIKKSLPKATKINFKKPCIMGILNITPDSFYDGGKYLSKEFALSQFVKLVNEGADIIDIGGESTRPGAKKISIKEEINRVIPVLQSVKKKKTSISLDSRKPEVISKALGEGINLINDVSGLRYSKKILNLLRSSKLPFIIMHSISDPKNMQRNIKYDDVLLDVYDFFESQIEKCRKNSIDLDNIIIDPGIGFGKTVKQNLKLISNISLFHSLGFPILLGASRKTFIGKLSKNTLNSDRLGGSIAIVLYGLTQGVQIFRVHDVHETVQAIKIFSKI